MEASQPPNQVLIKLSEKSINYMYSCVWIVVVSLSFDEAVKRIKYSHLLLQQPKREYNASALEQPLGRKGQLLLLGALL